MMVMLILSLKIVRHLCLNQLESICLLSPHRMVMGLVLVMEFSWTLILTGSGKIYGVHHCVGHVPLMSI